MHALFSASKSKSRQLFVWLLLLILVSAFSGPLHAEGANIGSVFGGRSPSSLQSTSKIISDTRNITSILRGNGALYFEYEREDKGEVIYPMFGYGERFWEIFLWEVGTYAGRNSKTKVYSLGTNATLLRETTDAREYEFHGALGWFFHKESAFKIGFAYNTIIGPTHTEELGAAASGWGAGNNTLYSQGPYVGVEFNIPIDDANSFYFFTDVYYYFTKGNLDFDAAFFNQNQVVSYYNGESSLEAHSLHLMVGLKYFVFKDYGIKLGAFVQESASRTQDLSGLYFTQGFIVPLIRTEKKTALEFYYGGYLGITSRF